MSREQIYKDMRRFLPLILAVAATFLPLMFMHSCANTTEAPSGGDKDTIPPYIIDIKPLPGATQVPVKDAKFEFTFNEYVTLKTATNVFLSPPQQKPPKARMKGKDLVVTFEEDLKPNTTYTLSFTDAIADANEGNMFAGYTYVFSTGSQIDSMMLTGTILDCNTLTPIKGATVLLHKSQRDSAVYDTKPYAAAKTDDWGFFVLPFIQDTLYRIYAIKDANNNNILEPDSELVGFIDSLVRPVQVAHDTVKEMLKYDMLDTLRCLARNSEYELVLFKEVPSKQMIMNKERLSERAAYITFAAQDAIVDKIEVQGYRDNQIITQFNLERDSLELWLNSRRPFPDTMKFSIDYYKTDSLGSLSLTNEKFNLSLANNKRTFSKKSRRDIKQNDTSCVITLTADPKTVEQNGFIAEFNYPIIYENFDKIKLISVNPRQVEEEVKTTVERDSLNLRKYIIRPVSPMQMGYEYTLKIPHRGFRDINGHYNDSLKVQCSLPTDDKLSTLNAEIVGVDRKIIVDLLPGEKTDVLRSYVIDKDQTLKFPYLSAGKYRIRITEDKNRNSLVDTGSLLQHKQPERVKFYEINGERIFEIPTGSELVQTIDISTIFID